MFIIHMKHVNSVAAEVAFSSTNRLDKPATWDSRQTPCEEIHQQKGEVYYYPVFLPFDARVICPWCFRFQFHHVTATVIAHRLT